MGTTTIGNGTDDNYVARHKVGVHQLDGAQRRADLADGKAHVTIRSHAVDRLVSTELGYGGADYAMLRAPSVGAGA